MGRFKLNEGKLRKGLDLANQESFSNAVDTYKLINRSERLTRVNTEIWQIC